jgi:hypothetical protein
LGQLGIELWKAQDELDKATSLLTELKARTLDFMGDAKTGVVNGEIVATRSARNGGSPFLTIKK